MKPKPRFLRLMGLVLLCALFFSYARKAEAAACAANANSYRSAVATGNWAANATWQVYNGTTWVAAGCWPSSVDGAIEIQRGNNITVTAAITVDQVTIDAGGTVTVNAGQTWTIANGAGTDLTVNGTVVNTGTIAMTGTAAFNSGSVYQHNQNAGTIPTATWATTSTVLVTGVTTTAPGGLGQSFGNFTWQSAQTARIELNGALTTINGNFTVNQTSSTTGCTGNGTRSLVLVSGTASATINIGGDFIGSGSYTSVNLNRGTGTATINLAGNFNFTGAYFASHYDTAARTTTFNFTGANKTFSETTPGWLAFSCGGPAVSDVDFVVASGASLTLNSAFPLPVSGTTDTNSLTVASGGTLNTGTNMVSGQGAFTLASGATLGIGSADGITSSGATGNIQTTGTRSYSTGANYIYNGSGAQNAGNGLPATVNSLQTMGGGSKTFNANLTVTNGLTVGTGTTYSQTAGNLTAGALTINGIFAQTAGNLSPGTITVNGGGSFQYGGTGTITIGAGGVTNNGVFVVDGNGKGCRTTDTRAAITAAAVRSWSGTGSFRLTDVTLNNQSNNTGTIITAFHAPSGGGGFRYVADCTGAPTAVRLASFTATAHGGRVLLKWHTAMETNNIGFRLYREAGDASSPVTPHLISGSALTAGLRATMSGGRSYVWWDDLPAGVAARTTRYWLVDVDLRGGVTFHGPVVPDLSREPGPDVRNAPHLQQLARLTGAGAPGASQGSSGQGGPAGGVFRRTSPVTPTAGAVQWALASARSLKLGISHSAWYQVTGQDLTDHGLGNVDPARLQLFADGQQLPLVTRGLARGRSIVPQSTIEFYATGLDNQWLSERTYWLAAGTSAGRRIGKVTGAGTPAAPTSFAFTVGSAPKVIYFPALMNGDPDKYFGPLVSTDAQAPTTLTLDVHNAAPAGQAALDVAVQGVMDGSHVVAVLVNGNQVGQVEFDGQELGTAHLLLDQSASLIEGSNQIALWAEGGELDFSLVKSVGLTYLRQYVADGDTLSMTAPGNSHLLVSGFVSPHVRMMDVTDPENPYELVAAVQNDGSSAYAVATDVAGPGLRNLLAFTDERIESPSSLKSNSPSSWHSADQAANLVILTHAAVVNTLSPLVQLRQGQGYSVAVVDVEDVYDEFGFGNKTPQALRDFLALATSTWRKPPGFVLLAGSASSDPRNFLGYGAFDLVPTKFVEATYSYAASDDWFVDFNDDGLPDLAIGRLPVRDSTQAAAVVQKLTGYGSAGSPDWTKAALLVADTTDGQFDYGAYTNAVAAQIPTSIFLKQVFRSDFANDTLAHAAVLGAFNQGALLVNYMGHSSETAWRGNLLTTEDVSGLTNGLSLPFVSSMTCWTGLFVDPVGETLGEALLKTPQGGAIAVWASSGMTETDGQMVMDREFMRLLFAAQKPTIGEATAQAKAVVSDLDIRRTWILLGDPTTKLQ